jgi:dienelactone hydrolase
MSGSFVREFRELILLAPATDVAVRAISSTDCDGFARDAVSYEGDDGREIPAFFFRPTARPPIGGVVVFHQHNSEFHLGKSEVAGLAGNPLQAFGPALARRGLAVLAPDAETFEDRRAQARGIEPHAGDWLQHYNGMGYRLINGDLIMRKHLDDGQRAVSALIACSSLKPSQIGISGHSFGGTLSLYLGALDERCHFVCSSGAVVSLAARQAAGTGIGMIELVPGLAGRFEMADVVGAIPPRQLLLVSATEDPYSSDADRVVEQAGVAAVVQQLRVSGGHALNRERSEAIVEWLVARASNGELS